MNMMIMVSIIIAVVIVGIYVITMTYSGNVLREKASVIENFNNPQMMSMSPKTYATVDCVEGNKYRITIHNFEIDYKMRQEMTIDVTARIFNTEKKKIHNMIKLPMKSSTDISFDYTLTDYDILKENENSKFIITLVFWKYYSMGCYDAHRGEPSDTILEKCPGSYLGSVDMILSPENIKTGDCASSGKWHIEYGSALREVLEIEGKTTRLMVRLVKVDEDGFHFAAGLLWPDHTFALPYSDRIGCTNPDKAVSYEHETGIILKNVYDTATCEVAPGPALTTNRVDFAKITLSKIDKKQRKLQIDINPVAIIGSGDWRLKNDIVPVKTKQGNILGKLYLKLLSQSIVPGDVDVYNFVVSVQNKYYKKLCTLTLGTNSVGENSAQPCGIYSVYLKPGVDMKNKILDIGLIAPENIQNLDKGDANYCQIKKNSALGECEAYQGQCKDDSDCLGNCVIVVITEPQMKACCQSRDEIIKTCRERFMEWWIIRNDYDKWKSEDYALTTPEPIE